MTFRQTMSALNDAGSAQTRKIYGRHGVNEPLFGVSYTVIAQLTKRAKTDHALAAFTTKAISAARRIGKIEVDHGETGCRTPDAEPYIRKMIERQRAH